MIETVEFKDVSTRPRVIETGINQQVRNTQRFRYWKTVDYRISQGTINLMIILEGV